MQSTDFNRNLWKTLHFFVGEMTLVHRRSKNEKKVRNSFLEENQNPSDGGMADKAFLLFHMFSFLVFVAFYSVFIV